MSDTANMNLSIADQKQLETLVAEAERNRSDAQRLALDASKLLSVTSNRLSEYKDRGFFKRCWYKISGKQGELDRANQADLIAMQKFAYAYLTKLQEQNLLEAKAIAVIRSNLKDLQDEVGEIHDMINVIVRKFDARITKLENVTALQDWQIHINANEQQFRKDNRAICFIQLVFDYLDVMRKNNIPFDAIEGRPDLRHSALMSPQLDPSGALCRKSLKGQKNLVSRISGNWSRSDLRAKKYRQLTFSTM